MLCAGVPETSVDGIVSKLVALGYKVARSLMFLVICGELCIMETSSAEVVIRGRAGPLGYGVGDRQGD